MITLEYQDLEKPEQDIRRSRTVLFAEWLSIARSEARKLRSFIRASGKLRRGIDVKVAVRNYVLTMDVTSSEDYLSYVEHGTRPHWPPPAPIEEWVRAKNIASNPQMVSQIAFLIGRKIAREGTKGHHMVRDGVAVSAPRLEKRLEQAFNATFHTR